MSSVYDVFHKLQTEQNEIQLMSENETIIIDAEQRIIVIPESESLFGVKFDKDVERKYFQCPKIVGDNIDLSQCQIYIAYVAMTTQNQQYPETGVGLYHCDDVEISGDNITFSWKLSGNVFTQEGYIAFKVVAKQSIGGELSTRWNTVPAFGTILNTISDGEDIAEQYPDIINQLLIKMESVEQIATPEAMQNYVNNYLEEHPVTGGMTEEQEQQLNQNTTDITDLKSNLSDLSNSVINNYELISFAELASQERFYYSYENVSGKFVGWISTSDYTAHIYDVSNYNGQNLYVSFETIDRSSIKGHVLVYDKPVDSVFYGEYCETDKATIYKNVKIYIPDGATRIAINSKPNTDVVVSYAHDMKVANILSQQFGGVVNISAFDSSSSDKEKSQLVCTGSHDELVLQRAIDELPRGGEIVLANGTYNIDGFAIVEDTYKVAFGIRGNGQRDIIIRGTNQPVRKINSTVFTNTAIINVTQDALNCVTGTESRVSIIGYDGLERLYPYFSLDLRNIGMIFADNQHKLIAVDGKYFSVLKLENVFCGVDAGLATEGGIAEYELPNVDFIAIRGLDGANVGAGYRMTNCFVFGFGVAYDISGEHLIMEQCGTRFCDYTYRFGHDSFGNIHDITLINCCHELSRRFPVFLNGSGQAINLINYNAEVYPWSSQRFQHISKAIEGTNGANCGDITYTIMDSGHDTPQNWKGKFFENGSGSNFTSRNLFHKLSGGTSDRPTEPNDFEKYYDMDTNELLICIGGEWKKLGLSN